MAKHVKKREYHGMTGTPEFRSYNSMINRCCNPNSHAYPRYGGRGIKVCDRWRQSFLAFLEDMGQRPSSEHSIDRIDNDGDYTPDNCRWATAMQQGENKRVYANNTTGVTGVSPTGDGKFRAYVDRKGRRVNLGTFDSVHDAVVARKSYNPT